AAAVRGARAVPASAAAPWLRLAAHRDRARAHRTMHGGSRRASLAAAVRSTALTAPRRRGHPARTAPCRHRATAADRRDRFWSGSAEKGEAFLESGQLTPAEGCDSTISGELRRIRRSAERVVLRSHRLLTVGRAAVGIAVIDVCVVAVDVVAVQHPRKRLVELLRDGLFTACACLQSLDKR